MEIAIYNNKNAAVVFTSTVYFQGAYASTYTSDGTNPYLSINLAGYPLSDFTIEIKSDGYKTFTASLDKLNGSVIHLQKPLSPIIFAAISLAIAAYARSKKKTVGELTPQQVETFALIAAGIFGFSFIKQFLEAVGIWKSKDTKTLDNASTDPNSFWNPHFYLNLLSQGVKWTTGINTATADQWLSDIDDAFSFFGDNEGKVIGILKRCQTQATLSFLAWEYNHNTGGDFLNYLRGKETWYPWGGLSDSDVNEVNQYISKLKQY